MRGRIIISLSLLLGGCLAELGASEYEIVEQEIGGAAIDAEQATQRYAIRACYVGAGDPRIELELSPWIDFGDGEVEATLETDPELVHALTDQRSLIAPLYASFDATAACETGVVVRFTLATPGAGKAATVAWVLVGRALGDDPRIDDGSVALSLEPV